MTQEEIIKDLKSLGITKGDNIFLTIDLKEIGYFNKRRKQTLQDLFDVFRLCVGENGSFTTAAYTNGNFRFKLKKKIFKRMTPSYAGAFPNFLISKKECFRSLHPTNSVIGYGKNLEKIFLNHDHNSLSYSVMGEISKLPNSKFLMIGTIDKTNAPQSMHYCQEVLGLTKTHPLRGLFQIKYFDKNKKIKTYTRKDIGGCSSGGFKLFSYFMIKDIINIGNIGNANAVIMNAEEIIQETTQLIEKNKRIIMCDNSYCIDCYGNWTYNGYKSLMFYPKLIIKKILSAIIKKF